MATYYVRTDGNNANTGTGSATNQAWQTLSKALGASGISSGDIVYVAPGRYNESVTVAMTSATTTTRIVGDPTASQFSGVSAGEVLWTGLNTAGTKTITTLLLMTSKNYLSFENIHFEAPSTAGVTSSINCVTCTNTSFIRCQFTEPTIGNGSIISISSPISTALNFTLDSCHIIYNRNNSTRGVSLVGQNVADNSVVKNCIIMCHQGNGIGQTNLQCKVYNNTFIGSGTGYENQGGSASFPSAFRNNLFIGCIFGIYSNISNVVTENYNRFIAVLNTLSNITAGVNSSTQGGFGIFGAYALQQGLVFGQMLGTNQSSPNTSFGIATDAPTTDMYGIAWSGTSPDAGSATLRGIGAVGQYIPTERNASTITIAPGSTSQSIELYLGVTGLTASTSGLAAYYNRTRSADVQIPLVARTIGQAWTSGGFAEVNPNTMPGVYRLDLPDAAVAAGADDVTIVVRGASGTNGAVMTIKLSSGGLTAAQTASAILDAVGASYVTAGSIGYAIQNSNVASISGSTAAADELEGALLHNGTDYISAQLIAGGGGGAGDVGGNIINLNEDPEVVVQTSAWVGDWHTYVLRLVDSNGTPYDITNDTLAVTFTNVATGSAYAFGGGSATITKQMNGQGILSILNPAAYPSAAVIRLTVSATVGTDVRRFGPLEIEVLAP